MMAMQMTFEPTLNLTLSPKLIQQWRDEQATIEREIEVRRATIEEIGRKLDAAKVLAPSLFEQMDAKATERGSSFSTPSLTNAIVELLKEKPERSLEPRQIRQALEWKRVLEPGQSKNYFYTALKRAADRNLIINKGGAYVVLLHSPQNGETGGVAPPVSVSTSSESEVAVCSGSKGEWGA
jgi:hypothetical protein